MTLERVVVVDVKTGLQTVETRDLILVKDSQSVTEKSDNEKLIAYAKAEGWI